MDSSSVISRRIEHNCEVLTCSLWHLAYTLANLAATADVPKTAGTFTQSYALCAT